MKLPLKISGTGYLVDAEDRAIAGIETFRMDEAKEIVRACNAHDELLEALKELMLYSDECELILSKTHPNKAQSLRKRIFDANAAIAKAETP